MEQPQQQFLSETEDLIEQVFVALDELREQVPAAQQQELIAGIFRHVHRIKGSAASFGFSGLAEIAHEFEHMLEAIRSERVTVTDAVLDTCDNAATALSESLTLAASGVVEPSRRDLFESLRALAPASEPDPVLEATIATILSHLPTDLSQALTAEEKNRLARRYADGNSLCLVVTSFEIAVFEEQFYNLKEKLAEIGEVLSTSPAVDSEDVERINFRILLSTDESVQMLGTHLQSFPKVAITLLPPAATATSHEKTAEPAVSLQPTVLAPNFIRADLNDFDQLLSATHQLSRLTTAALDRAQSRLSHENESQLSSEAEEIRRSFLQLQNEMINLRMVSLGPILQRAARAGRAAARAVNKQIEFEVVGSELRLDKMLSDAIADPLVHLVRNAVDHGIETSEARLAMGKPERGKVTIEAVRVGSRTRLRVSDDGRGIDPAIISRAAMKLGIVDRASDVDMNRSLRLIFRPGFSTLSSPSTVSGRGVGLDIVENLVEQVGGEVRVSSQAGRSSIFEIRLPVTFSLLNATIVKAGDDSYCLTSDEVLETQQVARSEVETAAARRSLPTSNGVVPVIHLREMLGQADVTGNEELSVVTCELPLTSSGESGELVEIRNGKKLVGLLVDGVIGSEEVLVRSLGRHAGRWYGIAGATELRDGTVALVLDLPRLLANSKTIPR